VNTQNCSHFISIFPYITKEWKRFFKSLAPSSEVGRKMSNANSELAK